MPITLLDAQGRRPRRYRAELEYAPEALELGRGQARPVPLSSLGILVVDSHSGMETQTMITLGNNDYTRRRT